MVDPRVIHVMLAEEEVVLYYTILVDTLKSTLFKLVE